MQTIEETRRARLILLEQEAGSQTALADLIGKSAAQISQWKNASISASGRARAMHSDTAREIEERMRKPRGWMDTPLEFHESPSDHQIAHAVRIMECMSQAQRSQAVRVLDTLSQPLERNGTQDK